MSRIPISPWSPFHHAAFTVLWTAALVSNIGTWMYNAASGWLMTSLNPDPLIVSMVQVGTSLPVFLPLPAEHFSRAMRSGFRYARYNPHFRAALARAIGFFLFASAFWALLPLVARTRIVRADPNSTAFCWAQSGAARWGGAFCLPWRYSYEKERKENEYT